MRLKVPLRKIPCCHVKALISMGFAASEKYLMKFMCRPCPEGFRWSGLTRRENRSSTSRLTPTISRSSARSSLSRLRRTRKSGNSCRMFLAKVWVALSLSPRPVHVLFVPYKVDPVTGKRTLRMCISFVKLNSKTVNCITYRLPCISDLVERINGACYFSKFDLLDGFCQVRMRASDISKTAFTALDGNLNSKLYQCGCVVQRQRFAT